MKPLTLENCIVGLYPYTVTSMPRDPALLNHYSCGQFSFTVFARNAVQAISKGRARDRANFITGRHEPARKYSARVQTNSVD